MTEEKKDQSQEKEPQKKETEQAQKEEKSEERVLPKKDFFKGKGMENYLEKIEAEEALSTPKEVEKKEVEKPAPEKKAEKQAEETKPFKVLKHKGKEITVQTEEEYDKLASQGFDYTFKRQEDSRDRKDWEKDRDEKESKILQTGEAISKLIEGIERGDFKIVPTGEEKPEQDDLEDFDPEIRAEFQKLRDENKSLKGELGKLTEKSKVGDEQRKEQTFVKARDELDALHEDVRKEVPYDIIKDGERELSKDLFTGLCVQKFNEDQIRLKQDKDFKPRTFKEIFTDTAKDLQAIANFYKGKNSGIEEGDTVTSEILKEKYPEIFAEIGQSAVEGHLKEQELAAPSIRSIAREAKETKKAGKVTGLKDAFDKAFDDSEVSEGVKAFSKADYGLKND